MNITVGQTFEHLRKILGSEAVNEMQYDEIKRLYVTVVDLENDGTFSATVDNLDFLYQCIEGLDSVLQRSEFEIVDLDGRLMLRGAPRIGQDMELYDVTMSYDGHIHYRDSPNVALTLVALSKLIGDLYGSISALDPSVHAIISEKPPVLTSSRRPVEPSSKTL
jgi:hypothetical protein